MAVSAHKASPALYRLIADSASLYRAAAAMPCIVRPAIPILYFGDFYDYARSPLRVITVALNPSRHEFPRHDPWLRFPALRTATPGPDTPVPPSAIAAALDAYFHEQPYRSWFDPSFGRVLAGLGAAYDGAAAGTALHTNIGTSLATDPAWSRLGAVQRAALQTGGARLWHELVATLEPDLIIMSTAAQHLSRIGFPALSPLLPLWESARCASGAPRRTPYMVRQQWRLLPGGKPVLLTFAPAGHKPFGKVSQLDQRQIGHLIREVVASPAAHRREP